MATLRPTRSRVKDEVDLLLAGVATTVDDGRYMDDGRYVDDGRYRYLDVDRYRYLPPPPPADDGRYRYLEPPDDGRYRRTFVNAPGRLPQPVDRLLWMPSCDYDIRFEGYLDTLWPLGDGLDFTNTGDADYYGDEADVFMVTVDNEAATFRQCSCLDFGEEFEYPFKEALDIREEITEHPDLVVGDLKPIDLRNIHHWAGLPAIPTAEQTAAAIRADSTAGLGGAALDYSVWLNSEFFGEAGMRLADTLTAMSEEYYVRLLPVENFLLYTHSLRPGTVGKPVEGDPAEMVYSMTGDYLVSRVGYHSDFTGEVIGGWRSCWLEPFYRTEPSE